MSHHHQYAPLIQSIRDQLHLPLDVQFSHSLCEGNQCADFLAKKEANEDFQFFLHEFPPSLMSLHSPADANATNGAFPIAY
ncbi:hypothetical protein GYH30_055263 [Glycine max]|uniref:RNase H type-1 domain-containing protein n=2 Tax=Glycine subgen. Soja TaxID=1462606 RepID=A0A0R0EIP5_SOYBN|nr:hypothetical protein GYH30_055263 [Glycine max]